MERDTQKMVFSEVDMHASARKIRRQHSIFLVFNTTRGNRAGHHTLGSFCVLEWLADPLPRYLPTMSVCLSLLAFKCHYCLFVSNIAGCYIRLLSVQIHSVLCICFYAMYTTEDVRIVLGTLAGGCLMALYSMLCFLTASQVTSEFLKTFILLPRTLNLSWPACSQPATLVKIEARVSPFSYLLASFLFV